MSRFSDTVRQLLNGLRNQSPLNLLLPLTTLLIITVVCYGKMLNNYFYLDDTSAAYAGYLLVHDPSTIFTHYFDYIYVSRLWRYIIAISYVPNYLISGTDPWSYYLTELLLQWGNAVFAYLITRRLIGCDLQALLIAVLYSTSLNSADAVLFIAARTTLLGAFFFLATLHTYLKYVQDGYRVRNLVLCLTFFAITLGCHENSLLLPAVFTTVSIFCLPREKRLSRANLFCVGTFFVVVITLILVLKIGTGATDGSVIKETDIIGKMYHIFRNILAVIPTFTIPPFLLQSPVEIQHNSSSSFGWIETVASIQLILILLVARKLKEPVIYFGLAFFFIASILTAVPRWNYYPVFYPDYRLGDIRWSLGRYSYLAAFGMYCVYGTLLYRLFQYLTQKWDARITVPAISLIIAAYLAFNIFWIYDREAMWATLGDFINGQVSALKQANLKIDPASPHIFTENFVLYGLHGRNLLRVQYDAPDLQLHTLDNLNSARPAGAFHVVKFSFTDNNVQVYRMDK